MTDATGADAAAWPCDPCMVGCNAATVVRINVASVANDLAGTQDASDEDKAFWSRVADESARIAEWTTSSLGITGRASKARGDTDC